MAVAAVFCACGVFCGRGTGMLRAGGCAVFRCGCAVVLRAGGGAVFRGGRAAVLRGAVLVGRWWMFCC